MSEILDAVEKLEQLGEFVDALKDNKQITHLDALAKRFSATGLLKDQVTGYVKALEEFDPKSNCGKWYKAAYEGILNAGTKCDKKYCGPINDGVGGLGNTPAANCYWDIADASNAAAASSFQKFANALAKKCGELPRTSKNCDC